MPLSSGGSAFVVPASATPAIAGTATAVANVRKTLAIVIQQFNGRVAAIEASRAVIPGCGHHVAESKSVAMPQILSDAIPAAATLDNSAAQLGGVLPVGN